MNTDKLYYDTLETQRGLKYAYDAAVDDAIKLRAVEAGDDQMNIRKTLTQWNKAHNTLPDRELFAADADFARRLGLPTLAALSDMAATLEAHGGESILMAYVAPVLHVARGEANARLQTILHDDTETVCVPGLSAITSHVLGV